MLVRGSVLEAASRLLLQMWLMQQQAGRGQVAEGNNLAAAAARKLRTPSGWFMADQTG